MHETVGLQHGGRRTCGSSGTCGHAAAQLQRSNPPRSKPPRGKPPSSAVQELQKMARALWLKNEGVADDTTIIVCYCGGSGT